jgi:hypothetical protein
LHAAPGRKDTGVLIQPSIVLVSKFHAPQPPHEKEYPWHTQVDEALQVWFVPQQAPPQLVSVELQQTPDMHVCEVQANPH